MKKILPPILTLCLSFSSYSQTLYAPGGSGGIGNSLNGKVGIGTTWPNWNLEINGVDDIYSTTHTTGPNSLAGLGLVNDARSWVLRVEGDDGDKFQIRDATANAQRLTIDTNGKVGIGTTSPSKLLHLKSSSPYMRFEMGDGSFSMIEWYESTKRVAGIHWLGHQAPNRLSFMTGVSGSISERMSITESGNVGIGTTNPSSKLEIRKEMSADNSYETVSRLIGYRGASNHQHPMLTLSTKRGGNNPIDLGAVTTFYQEWGRGGLQFLTNDGNGLSAKLSIDKNGKVGIGTTDFSGSHKLRVEGSIGAREIKVEANGWSDFVFEKNYNLRSLEEVERHIEEKGHLPEIPSEDEVTENGINLGEMNAKLLQKIEELTLYLIEQNKKNQELQIRIEKLEKLNSKLSQKIE